MARGRYNLYHCPDPPRRTLRTCQVAQTQVAGRQVFKLEPKNKKKVQHLLYLHGGAYVQGFTRPHWRFLTELVLRTGCTVIAPDYPVAPKYTYLDSYAMVLQLYQQLIVNVSPSDICLAGDSAGGGFALALAQKIKQEGLPQPARIILLSPWLDITLTNPAIKALDAKDPFLGINGLRKAGKLYAGDLDPRHYLLSPVNGPLSGLGKLSVFVGTKEILAADARKLRSLAESAGVYVDLYEYTDMVHVWMFLNFPEARNAKKQIFDLLIQDIPGPI